MAKCHAHTFGLYPKGTEGLQRGCRRVKMCQNVLYTQLRYLRGGVVVWKDVQHVELVDVWPNGPGVV